MCWPILIARCCNEKQWINNARTTLFWPILVVYSAKQWWRKYHVLRVPSKIGRNLKCALTPGKPKSTQCKSALRRIKFLHLEALGKFLILFHWVILILLATLAKQTMKGCKNIRDEKASQAVGSKSFVAATLRKVSLTPDRLSHCSLLADAVSTSLAW